MKTIELNEIANRIAEHIANDGIEITVDSRSRVKTIFIGDVSTCNAVLMHFEVPKKGHRHIIDWRDTADLEKHEELTKKLNELNERIEKEHTEELAMLTLPAEMALEAKRLFEGSPVTTECVTTSRKKRDSRRWSRFNFEKNIMKMTWLALQDRYPAEESFNQHEFAAKLASMMHWKVSTAKRHITQAAKMGILNRAVIGTVYYVTGINDEDAQTLKEEVAKRAQAPEQMPLPFDDLDDEDRLATRSALAGEGRPLLEQQLEKAVDETVLP